MMTIVKKFLFCCLLIFCFQFAFGQNTKFTINEIDSIVKQTDSNSVCSKIQDYIFYKNKHKLKKIGSGADWFYTDTSRTKLLKVVRETYIKSDIIDIYYFYNDSLIYLQTSDNKYSEDKKKIYSQTGKYYFQNDTLIFKNDNLKSIFYLKIYLENVKLFLSKEQIW